jgi:hypothetical protein
MVVFYAARGGMKANEDSLREYKAKANQMQIPALRCGMTKGEGRR